MKNAEKLQNALLSCDLNVTVDENTLVFSGNEFHKIEEASEEINFEGISEIEIFKESDASLDKVSPFLSVEKPYSEYKIYKSYEFGIFLVTTDNNYLKMFAPIYECGNSKWKHDIYAVNGHETCLIIPLDKIENTFMFYTR